MKLVAISDLHYKRGENAPDDIRRTGISDILLLKAVKRVNRWIKPDLVILLGDLVDDGPSPEAVAERQHLAEIVNQLECTVMVLPGNHDGDTDEFYKALPRPPQTLDIGGVRFVTFVDQDEPEYHATRSGRDIQRMAEARAGWNGPLASVQHVPLFKPGTSHSPYWFLNAKEVWSAFETSNYTLSLSGHYHSGDDLVSRSAGPVVIAPSLCEPPFAFVEIDIDGTDVKTRHHQLILPRELELFDSHIHSQFAYCGENMDMRVSSILARELGLGGYAFCEHTGQLYFDKDTFWNAAFMRDGLNTQRGRQDRMQEFFTLARDYCPPAVLGLEVDCDYSGSAVIRSEDAEAVQLRLGAVHWLEELRKPEPDIELAAQEIVWRLERFLTSGIHVLAHPFRTFKRYPEGPPKWLIPKLVALLKQHNVAAEINFHTQLTTPDLVLECLNAGVKLALGSDSHNQHEVAELSPHLQLLRDCGCRDSDLADVLWRPWSLPSAQEGLDRK